MTQKSKKPGEVFEDVRVYDPGIEAIVPRYDELHDAVLNSPPQARDEPLTALELGAGTGELTTKFLTRFPAASVVAVDHSAGMLGEAERKLETFGERATIAQGAFPEDFPVETNAYDLVISTLAVHHLDDDQKQTLFEAVHDALVPGGWFVNGDVVALPDHLETVAGEMIENWVRTKGWSEEDFMNQWRASDDFDDPATLHDQLDWLRAAGFRDVTPVWQYYNFAVYGGRKSQ